MHPTDTAMRVNAPRGLRAAPLLILTALAGCDNVSWGGASVQVVRPPPARDVASVAVEADPTPTLGLPTGSVLFHVVRTANGATIVPVAEVARDSLRALRRPAGVSPQAFEQRFRETVLPPNAQLVLFRRGAAVGTVTVQGPAGVNACGVPMSAGQATTVAAAAAEGEFLAFRKGLEPEVRGEYVAPQVNGPIIRYASLVAEKLVLQNGLPRPRSWPGAQRNLQPLDVVHGGTPEMAATYLVGDELGVGGGQPDGWSVFYVASYETRTGYTPFYTEVRDYRKTGKAAPKLIDYLNWNGAGENEMLVQVFGPRDAWYEAVSRDKGGRWQKVWEGQPCR